MNVGKYAHHDDLWAWALGGSSGGPSGDPQGHILGTLRSPTLGRNAPRRPSRPPQGPILGPTTPYGLYKTKNITHKRLHVTQTQDCTQHKIKLHITQRQICTEIMGKKQHMRPSE